MPCKEDKAGGRVRAGQAGKKYSDGREGGFARLCKDMTVRKTAGGIPGSEDQLINMRLLPAAECRLPAGAREKIRQKFAPAGKSGIIYTRDEEEKSSSIHKTDSPSCSFLSLF